MKKTLSLDVFLLLFMSINVNFLFAATTRFANQVSQISLQPNANVRIADQSQVQGWNGLSFVRSTGGSGADYFGFEKKTIDSTDVYKNRVENTRIHPKTKTFNKSETINDLTLFQDGLTLSDSSVILDMKSPLGLLSPIALNGGTLSLSVDWPFSSASYMVTPGGGGSIKGNGYAIILYGDFEIPTGEYLKFKGQSAIEGLNHELILTGSSQLIIDTNSTLSLSNLTLKYVANSPEIPSIIMTNTSSQLSLHNVTIALSGDYTFTQGQLFIHNDVVICGTSSFIYASNQPSHIAQNSLLYFDIGTTFSYAPSNATAASNSSLINMEDKTSKLIFNNCSLNVSVAGLNVTKGTVILNNKLWIYNYGGTGAGDCFKFGDGSNSINDVNLQIYPGATINLIAGSIDYSNVN